MISLSESEIQKQIIDYLKLQRAYVIRHNAGRIKNNVRLAPDGTPDLYALLPDGRAIWIEVKTDTGKLRPSQTAMITILRSRKQKVIVARSLEDVINTINKR